MTRGSVLVPSLNLAHAIHSRRPVAQAGGDLDRVSGNDGLYPLTFARFCCAAVAGAALPLRSRASRDWLARSRRGKVSVALVCGCARVSSVVCIASVPQMYPLARANIVASTLCLLRRSPYVLVCLALVPLSVVYLEARGVWWWFIVSGRALHCALWEL